MMSLILYKTVGIAISYIDFINTSSNFLGKQNNNSDQGARIRWPIVPRSAQEKFIFEFAVILVRQCRDKQ